MMFLALMVGALGSLTPPPRGAGGAVNISCVDGGCSCFSITCQGATIDVSSVDGGRFRISDITSQGAHRQYFLVLMVDTHGSLSPLPRGPAIDAF
jgi:hypothetical protein